MTKHRRMNFSANKPRPAINPWAVLFFALAAAVVMWVAQP
jgi:hypothetical protein